MNEKKDADSEEEKDVFDLIYKLDDNPPVKDGMFAALQHLLAIIVGIITPTLVIGGVLGLGSEIPYLISMALIVSGVATFIQVKRIGPVGSGILSIQGTSFAFLGAILTAGFMVKNQGGGPNEILSTIFSICFFGAFIEMVLSRFLQHLRKIITPVVTGTVVTLIGLVWLRWASWIWPAANGCLTTNRICLAARKTFFWRFLFWLSLLS